MPDDRREMSPFDRLDFDAVLQAVSAFSYYALTGGETTHYLSLCFVATANGHFPLTGDVAGDHNEYLELIAFGHERADGYHDGAWMHGCRDLPKDRFADAQWSRTSWRLRAY